MVQLKWVNYGLCEIAKDKSKWLEKRHLIDPYGNAISYDFCFYTAADDGEAVHTGTFSMTLNFSYKEKCFIQLRIEQGDVDTDEKITDIINKIFGLPSYQLVFGLVKQPVYKNSSPALQNHITKDVFLPVAVNEKIKNISVDSLLKQYTKELADFLN